MSTNIDRAAEVIRREFEDDSRVYDEHSLSSALAAEGLLAPEPPEAVGKTPGGAPIYRACEFEVRPAGYEHRVICTDVNGPWESTAQDVRNFAASLLAAANYAEENQ